MTLFQRARYALYLAVVANAFVGLLITVACADAIALLPRRASNLIGNPILLAVTYVLALFVAPWMSERLPIRRW